MSIVIPKVNSIDYFKYIDLYSLSQEIVFVRSCIEHNGEEMYVKYRLEKIVEILPIDNGAFRCYHTPDSNVTDIRECLFNDFIYDFSDNSYVMC
jgi:hypothetical protein